MADRETALPEADDLTKTFSTSAGVLNRTSHGVEAVRGVSFALARGGSLGIVGESGSGKTTVARILMGLERPTAGVVRIDSVKLDASTRMGDPRARARGI